MYGYIGYVNVTTNGDPMESLYTCMESLYFEVGKQVVTWLKDYISHDNYNYSIAYT